tara:strand:+ start:21 stop:215 length:195 start_codon:yes stop_codon:yes gene_type:complete
MKKTLIITALIIVAGGLAVNEAFNAFHKSPLGKLKQINDQKQNVEKLIKDGPLEIKPQPALKLQ